MAATRFVKILSGINPVWYDTGIKDLSSPAQSIIPRPVFAYNGAAVPVGSKIPPILSSRRHRILPWNYPCPRSPSIKPLPQATLDPSRCRREPAPPTNTSRPSTWTTCLRPSACSAASRGSTSLGPSRRRTQSLRRRSRGATSLRRFLIQRCQAWCELAVTPHVCTT